MIFLSWLLLLGEEKMEFNNQMYYNTLFCLICLHTLGQRVKEHCTPDSPNDGQCELCESGTYNSVANFQETSQPCTSCSHPNGTGTILNDYSFNLQVAKHWARSLFAAESRKKTIQTSSIVAFYTCVLQYLVACQDLLCFCCFVFSNIFRYEN